MLIPASPAWWGESEAGAAWLARLPQLAHECATAWDLELGEAYDDAYASLVLRARRGASTPRARPPLGARPRARLGYEGPAGAPRWLPRHLEVARVLSAPR